MSRLDWSGGPSIGSSRYSEGKEEDWKSAERFGSSSGSEDGVSWKRTDLDGSVEFRRDFFREELAVWTAGRCDARSKSEARDGLLGLVRVGDWGVLPLNWDDRSAYCERRLVLVLFSVAAAL